MHLTIYRALYRRNPQGIWVALPQEEAAGLGRTYQKGGVMADQRDEGFKNQVKGLGKQAEGKIRNVVGGMRGDTSEQIKGKAQEIRGKIQRKAGESQSDYDKRVRDHENHRDEP